MWVFGLFEVFLHSFFEVPASVANVNFASVLAFHSLCLCPVFFLRMLLPSQPLVLSVLQLQASDAMPEVSFLDALPCKIALGLVNLWQGMLTLRHINPSLLP